jgi:hypothetical protein
MNELLDKPIAEMSGFAEQLPKSRENAQSDGVSNIWLVWRVSEGEGPKGH